MLITILFIRAFVLGKALVGQIILNMLLPSPLFCWWKSQSPSLSLCLSRDPEQSPRMDWNCSPGCCHTVTEAIPVTVRVSLSCHLSSDRPGDQPCSPTQVLMLLSAGCSPQIQQETQIWAALCSAAWAAGAAGGKESGRCSHPVCVRESRIPREEWCFVWMVVEQGFLSFLPEALFGYLEMLFLVEHHWGITELFLLSCTWWHISDLILPALPWECGFVCMRIILWWGWAQQFLQGIRGTLKRPKRIKINCSVGKIAIQTSRSHKENRVWGQTPKF